MKKCIWAAVMMMALLLVIQCSADVTNTFVSSADTGIRDATNVYGSDTYMYIYGGSSYNMGYVRFDLSGLGIYQVVSASLKFTIETGAPRADVMNTGRFSLHGLQDVQGNTPQDWDETTLNRSQTGAEVDWNTGGGTLDMSRLVNLDGADVPEITETTVPSAGSWEAGTTVTVTGNPLNSFLQSRLDDDGRVTFIIRCEATNGRGYGLAARENANELYRPVLELTYIPGGAVEPQPADGSTVTDLNLPQLSWTNYLSDLAVVWFGQADANELNYKTLLANIAEIESPSENSSVAVPTESLPLDVPAVYTWVVESYKYPDSDPNHIGDPNQLISTKVWHFYTSAKPVVLGSPVDQFVFPAQSAAFTANFEALTEITGYVWYKDGVPVSDSDSDIEITSADLGNKQYTTTLTVSNAETADEGLYTCVAENSGGFSEPTGGAYLVVKRQLAWWNFDAGADDSQDNYNGTLLGDPNFVTDGNHQAIQFDGTDDYVQLPQGFANFKSGLTFAVWAKPAAANSWARFLDLGNFDQSDPPVQVNNILFTRNGTSATLRLDTGNGTLDTANALTLDEWQFLVAAVDANGSATIYRNGFQINSGTISLPTIVTRMHNYIGESNWESDAFYSGLMDDLRVYNYAVDADTLATMYTDLAGSYCRVRPELDWSGNCVVDLADLTMFIDDWLECGLWPVSACQ